MGAVRINLPFDPETTEAKRYWLEMSLAEWDALKEEVETRLRQCVRVEAGGNHGIFTEGEFMAYRNPIPKPTTPAGKPAVRCYKLRDGALRWWFVTDGVQQATGPLVLNGTRYEDVITKALQRWEEAFKERTSGRIIIDQRIFEPAELAAELG